MSNRLTLEYYNCRFLQHLSNRPHAFGQTPSSPSLRPSSPILFSRRLCQRSSLRFQPSHSTVSIYVELKEGAEAAAKADGDQLIFLDANGDVNKQNNGIQDLISRGVKVLILNPVNPPAVAPSIEATKAAGIPVITVDRPVEKGAVTDVGRDNRKMGELGVIPPFVKNCTLSTGA